MIVQEIFQARQALILYTIEELGEMLREGRIITREPNKLQVRAIRKYVRDNIMSGDIYFPPLVAAGELGNGNPQSFHLIDGVNVLHALTSLNVIIDKSLKSPVIEEKEMGLHLLNVLDEVKVAIQILDGLSEEEQGQLYIDLNSHGKKVALSKKIAYDSRNIINIITNDLLRTNESLQIAGIEHERTVIVRPNNKQFLSLSQLRGIVCIFITGKVTSTRVLNVHVNENLLEERLSLVHLWFEELFSFQDIEEIGNYHITMLASFPLIQALALYTIEGIENNTDKETYIKTKMQKIKHINWDREQKVWRQFPGITKGKDQYFYLKNTKKTIEMLVSWLKSEGGEADVKKSER